MIKLQRQVDVHTFDAEATVAVGKDRPEYLSVARLAKDLARPLDGRTVARELLGGLPEQVGWRVIERCVALGLLKREADRGAATLSDYGEEALRTGKVLVPEEGLWRFYMAEDVLVESSLIHVERLDAGNAKEERDALFQAKQQKRSRPDPGQPRPEYLGQCAEVGWIFNSLVQRWDFAVEEIAKRGELGPKGALTLCIDWEPGKRPGLRLRGSLLSPPKQERPAHKKEHQEKQAKTEQEKAVPLRVDYPLDEPEVCAGTQYEQVWQYLVAAGLGVPVGEVAGWCNKTGEPLAPVAFSNKLPNAARSTMSMDVQAPRGELPGLGEFEETAIAGVKLVPRTPGDAQQWAEWLQWQLITRYATPAWIADHNREIRARFPHHRPALPDADSLIVRALKIPGDKTARYLLAPYDLGLWS